MVLSTLRTVFSRRPLLANIATFSSLLAAADATCQVIQHKTIKFDYEWKRTINFAIVGIIYSGPVGFYYYRWVDRRFPGKSPRNIGIKLILDQCIFTVFSIPMYFVCEYTLIFAKFCYLLISYTWEFSNFSI